MKRYFKWFSLGSFVPVIVVFTMFVSMVGAVFTGQSDNNGDDGISLSEYGEAEIPAEYIPIYKEAGKAYDIAWTLLAAFHKVETNFGTTPTMISYAGALGHFQFLPETWLGWGYGMSPPKEVYQNPAMIQRYGGYGVDANNDGVADPFDIRDSAHSAANYVKASGGMENLYSAIFAYNHADWYVEKVMMYYKKYSSGDYHSVGGTGGIGKDGFMIPIKNPIITSGFSQRVDPLNPQGGGIAFHYGLDFGNPHGTPIMASKKGTVVISQYDGMPVTGYGKCTIIDHHDGTWTLYAHQSSQFVKVGDSIKQGQVIGEIGSTGESTGPHLHFEIRKSLLGGQVDPAPILGL